MDNRRNQAASRQGSSTCLADPTIVHRDVVVLPCVLSYNEVDEGEGTAGKSKTTMQLKYEDGAIKAPALTRPVGVKTQSGYVRVWRSRIQFSFGRSSEAVRIALRHALGDVEDCTMNDRT